MASFTLIDGHSGGLHVFSADDEHDFRSRIEEATDISPDNQIILVNRSKNAADDGWRALTSEEIGNTFGQAADEPIKVDAVCFDRRKIGGGQSGAAATVQRLLPDVVLLPSQQTIFNPEEAEYESNCLEAASARHDCVWSSNDKQGYVRRLVEVRLFLLNLHTAAATIVEGGQERATSIRLALSQHDRFQTAFDAVTSQTRGKCVSLISDGDAATQQLQQTLLAAALVSTEAPAWMETLSSTPLQSPAVLSSTTAEAKGEDGLTQGNSSSPKTLADTLPAGHFSRLNELVAQCSGHAKSLVEEFKSSALPALHQQVRVFESICSQAGSYAVGRREAFAALVSRAEADTATQKKSRAQVDAAFRDAVRACEVIFAAIEADTSAGMEGGGADGHVSAAEHEDDHHPHHHDEGQGMHRPSEEEIAWALNLLSTPPFVDGALDSCASSLASSDAHLASLQQQAHALLVEAATAVNGHLGTVAAVQSAASGAAEVTAEVRLATHALSAACGELQHLRWLPGAYEALLAEQRRRDAFDAAMASACALINSALQAAAGHEQRAREGFLSQFAPHLPGVLLAGLLHPQHPESKEDEGKQSLPPDLAGLQFSVAWRRGGDGASTDEPCPWAPVVAADALSSSDRESAAESKTEEPVAAPSLEQALVSVADWAKLMTASKPPMQLADTAGALEAAASQAQPPLKPIHECGASCPSLAYRYRCASLEAALAALLSSATPSQPPAVWPLHARQLRLQSIGKALLDRCSPAQKADLASKDAGAEGTPAAVTAAADEPGSPHPLVRAVAATVAGHLGPPGASDESVALPPKGFGFLVDQIDRARTLLAAAHDETEDGAVGSGSRVARARSGSGAFLLNPVDGSAGTESPSVICGKGTDDASAACHPPALLTLADVVASTSEVALVCKQAAADSAADPAVSLLSRHMAALFAALGPRLDRCFTSHLAFRASSFRVGENALFFPQGRRTDSQGRPIYSAFQSQGGSQGANSSGSVSQSSPALASATAASVSFYLDHDASVLTLTISSSQPTAGSTLLGKGGASPGQPSASSSPASKKAAGAPPSPPLLALLGGSAGSSPSSQVAQGSVPASARQGGASLSLRSAAANAASGATPHNTGASAPSSPALFSGSITPVLTAPPALALGQRASSASGGSHQQWPDFVIGRITSIRALTLTSAGSGGSHSGPFALFGGNLTVPAGARAFAVGVTRVG